MKRCDVWMKSAPTLLKKKADVKNLLLKPEDHESYLATKKMKPMAAKSTPKAEQSKNAGKAGASKAAMSKMSKAKKNSGAKKMVKKTMDKKK